MNTIPHIEPMRVLVISKDKQGNETGRNIVPPEDCPVPAFVQNTPQHSTRTFTRNDMFGSLSMRWHNPKLF